MPDPRGLLPTLRAARLLLTSRALRGRVRVERQARVLRTLARSPLGRSGHLRRTLAAHERVDQALRGALNCLDRSVALWADLRAQGHPAELRFGVRTRDGSFEAHAWVELDGASLTDTEDEIATWAPFDGDLGPRFVDAVRP